VLQADVQVVRRSMFCRLMYKCAALRVLQAVVEVVGHFCVLQVDVQFVRRCIFCRLMFNLCGTSCAAGCCTILCSAGLCTICAALCVLQADVQVVRHFDLF
jgi:hypothetical protein